MTALVTVLAGIQTMVFLFGQGDIEEQLESSAKGLAASVAQIMALDSKDYRALIETRDIDSEYYKMMHERLASIKRESSVIKYIYTERRLDSKTTEFILDAEPIGSENYSPLGSLDPNNADKEKVFAVGKDDLRASNVTIGHRTASGDRWGKLIEAYAPIIDDAGESLGLVGVDMDGEHLYRQFHRINTGMTVANLVIIALSLASLLKFSDAILDRVFKDKLTGALAKRHFEGLLNEEMVRAIKHRSSLALLMLDLDHFKAVNDTYGHVFGDTVLASVAQVVKRSIRAEDYFVRYGGEEFAVIMAHAVAKNAVDAAERVRAAVEAAPVFNAELGKPVGITISIGVAPYLDASQTASDLIGNADKALYQAKVTRNAVSLFARKQA
jgi:diguanylate cyclase (GGDEF)-like protein